MKIRQQKLIILLFLMSCIGFSQTPEQQKMIDKALKMRDSIMQCIGLEELLQQANAQEKRLELAEKSKNNRINPIPKSTINEDKYWKNTLASNNNTILIN